MNISKTKSFSKKKKTDIKVFFRIERYLAKPLSKLFQLCSFCLCSIIITELLSTSLKSELKFLPFSEMGKFPTLALNFKDWPFGVMVTRHFRRKLDHLNERVYCCLIDRTSKMLLIKEYGSILWPTSSELQKLLVLG